MLQLTKGIRPICLMSLSHDRNTPQKPALSRRVNKKVPPLQNELSLVVPPSTRALYSFSRLQVHDVELAVGEPHSKQCVVCAQRIILGGSAS